MSRWFRHYAGMMRDEKLVAVAIRSKQPVERVTWIWGAILESAAEIDDAGRFELDAAEAAYFLRADEADICAVLTALAGAGRVAEGCVVKWGDRQYQSDKSAERQARYRARRRAGDGGSDDSEGASDVTRPSRDGAVTPQETEKETEEQKEAASAASCAPAPKMPGLTECERQVIASLRSANVDPSSFPDVGHAALWQAQGYDPAICAALVSEALKKGKRVRSLAWFDERVREAHERKAPPAVVQPEIPRDIWDIRVGQYRTEPNRWPNGLGRPPDHPDCKAPTDILAKHGYRSAA